MPELVRILTDDQGTITHMVTDEEERLSVPDLAAKLNEGLDYYITFGEDQRYPITIVAEDGHLEPTVEDPDGIHTIWDLPQEEDPEELELPEMFDDLGELGEFDDDTPGRTRDEKDLDDLL